MLQAYEGVSALERLEIELLLEAIFRHYGHDFRSYAFSSLRRRFRWGCTTLSNGGGISI